VTDALNVNATTGTFDVVTGSGQLDLYESTSPADGWVTMQDGSIIIMYGTNVGDAFLVMDRATTTVRLSVNDEKILIGLDLDMNGNDAYGVNSLDVNNAINASIGTFSGNLTGEVPISLDTTATVVLTAADCRGTIRMNNDDDVIDYTLPDAEVGLVVSIANTIYDQVITVDPQVGDAIILNDRTVNTTGNAVDSSGAKDDSATFVALSSTQWLMYSAGNTWVDGGTD